jgi:hypothetical protein
MLQETKGDGTKKRGEAFEERLQSFSMRSENKYFVLGLIYYALNISCMQLRMII